VTTERHAERSSDSATPLKREDPERRRDDVVDADGVRHGRVEGGHRRTLTTIFGTVNVERPAYRAPGAANLHPRDAGLNLPAERHSHGLRRLAAIEAVRGSFDDAVTAIDRATGVKLGKRQVEQLARAAAVDVDAFYAAWRPEPDRQPGEQVTDDRADEGATRRDPAHRRTTPR
jgi:hypothetical protein